MHYSVCLRRPRSYSTPLEWDSHKINTECAKLRPLSISLHLRLKFHSKNPFIGSPLLSRLRALRQPRVCSGSQGLPCFRSRPKRRSEPALTRRPTATFDATPGHRQARLETDSSVEATELRETQQWTAGPGLLWRQRSCFAGSPAFFRSQCSNCNICIYASALTARARTGGLELPEVREFRKRVLE